MSYVQATINVKTLLQYINAIKNSINVQINSLDRSLKSFINISKTDIEKLRISSDNYHQFNIDPDKALIEMMTLSQKIKKMNLKKINIKNIIKKNPEAKEILILEEKKESIFYDNSDEIDFSEEYEKFQSEKVRINEEIQSMEKKSEDKKKELRELESQIEKFLSDNTKMVKELRKTRNNTEISLSLLNSKLNDMRNKIKTLRFQLHLDLSERKIIEKELENKINEYDNIIKDNVTIQISNKNIENKLEEDLINSLNISTDDSINNSINEETTITMSKTEFCELQRKYKKKDTVNNDIELLKNDLEFLKQQNDDLKMKNDIIVKFMKSVEIRSKCPLFSPVRRRKSSNL